MRIGFQGDDFSNSYYAALKFSENNDIRFEGVPLINSSPVIRALVNDEIDYGVVAYKNSIAGLVKETDEATRMYKELIEEIDKIELPIHHCLFMLPGENVVKKIYSHEQALRQCDEFIKEHYPNASIIPEKDTSLAALKLVSNEYESGTAVICNKDCGKHYGLELIHENMESETNNHTTFKVYVKRRN